MPSETTRGQLMMIHLTLSGLMVALLIFTGCEKISEKPPELGEEVSGEAINNAFDKVLGEINPMETRAGDHLFYVTNRRLEQQENSLTIGTLDRTVKTVEDLERGIRITIHTVDHEYNYEQSRLVKVRDEDCVLELSSKITYSCPSDEETKSSFEQQNLEKIRKFNTNNVEAQDENPIISAKYYNLQTLEKTIPAPNWLSEKPNCAGLSPCQLSLTYIQYDIVAKYRDGSLRRFHIDRSITPNLRYMGPDGIDYETCLSTSIDYQGRPIFLRDCTFLGDLVKKPL